MVKLPEAKYLFLYRFCISVEHRERVSLNAPPHIEKLILTTGEGFWTQILTIASPVLYHQVIYLAVQFNTSWMISGFLFWWMSRREAQKRWVKVSRLLA